MAENPYDTLGVSKDTSDTDIKSAYRKLAKQNHPDLNPGNEAAKTRFSQISAAYDLLSDKDKRAAFDRGEIDESGQPRQQQFYRDYSASEGAHRYRQPGAGAGAAGGGGPGGFDASSFSDIFSSMFGGGGARGGAQESNDAHYSIEIDFLEAAKGASKRITMPDGAVLDLVIPEGIKDGQQLRLKGKGHKGRNGQTGDAYVELHIRAHELFTREGNDIAIELPIGFHESVLGSKISVPTIHGPVSMAIPKGATTGQTLRLKGKGVKGGDEFVRLKIVMPPKIDSELEAAISEWVKSHLYDPRAALRGKMGGRLMITLDQLLAELQGELDLTTLETYVAHSWVRPVKAGQEFRFEDIDIARIRLVQYLQRDIAVNDEGMDVVLNLLDQLYDLRRRMGLHIRDEEAVDAAEFWESQEEF